MVTTQRSIRMTAAAVRALNKRQSPRTKRMWRPPAFPNGTVWPRLSGLSHGISFTTICPTKRRSRASTSMSSSRTTDGGWPTATFWKKSPKNWYKCSTVCMIFKVVLALPIRIVLKLYLTRDLSQKWWKCQTKNSKELKLWLAQCSAVKNHLFWFTNFKPPSAKHF